MKVCDTTIRKGRLCEHDHPPCLACLIVVVLMMRVPVNRQMQSCTGTQLIIYCEHCLWLLQKTISGQRPNQKIRSPPDTSGGEVTLSMVNSVGTWEWLAVIF